MSFVMRFLFYHPKDIANNGLPSKLIIISLRRFYNYLLLNQFKMFFSIRPSQITKRYNTRRMGQKNQSKTKEKKQKKQKKQSIFFLSTQVLFDEKIVTNIQIKIATVVLHFYKHGKTSSSLQIMQQFP